MDSEFFYGNGFNDLILVLFMREIPSVLPLEANFLTTASEFRYLEQSFHHYFCNGRTWVSGGIANILTSIELPITIFLARLILSETVTLLQWIGIAIILVAIVFNELGTNLFRIRKSAPKVNGTRSSSG